MSISCSFEIATVSHAHGIFCEPQGIVNRLKIVYWIIIELFAMHPSFSNASFYNRGIFSNAGIDACIVDIIVIDIH